MMRLKKLSTCSWGLAQVAADQELIDQGLAIISDRTGLVHITPRGIDLVPQCEVLDV